MIKWLISLMMVCSLSVTVSACNPDDSLKNTENTVPEPEPNPDPTPEPVTGNGMFDLSKGENGNPPSIRLSSGYDMPIIGLGTYSLHGKVCVNAILSAVKHGYRKFDTASFYGNEEEVGEAIRTCGVPREELFVCTKLYPNQFADAEKAIEESLRKLNIGLCGSDVAPSSRSARRGGIQGNGAGCRSRGKSGRSACRTIISGK